MSGSDGKTVLPGEIDERLVVLLRRAKAFGELLRSEVLAVDRAGRIVELIEQIGE